MWKKWVPWRLILRRMARAGGFIDPIALLSRLERFAQPSEVATPVELLRLGSVLQARGLVNAQAIQHNLDWVWPYWAVRQFDPRDASFIPRAFSATHINLTHRNWTAVGLPDFPDFPIVDSRGLVTPFYDGWSIDAWVLKDHDPLIPSRLRAASQQFLYRENLAVVTHALGKKTSLISRVEAYEADGVPVCRISVRAESDQKGWLAVSLRPYNPEGVSWLHDIALFEDGRGWRVNQEKDVHFSARAERHAFSEYRAGDVYRKLPASDDRRSIFCEVGLATAAALFELRPDTEREIIVMVPLKGKRKGPPSFQVPASAAQKWEKSLEGHARIKVPDSRFQFLYEASLRTLVLLSPGSETFPGPFTYKHFWFRDAVMIVQAFLEAGLTGRAEKILDAFPKRQMPSGYFHSQSGEWDSNGQVLWVLKRFVELTGKELKPHWIGPLRRGARWIVRKRLSKDPASPHAGLFPASFSAEHLGPNDYYYWDDFWGVAGLLAAAELFTLRGETDRAKELRLEADEFLRCIEKSLRQTRERYGHSAMPASPYRRMDAGAIGSLAAAYPLKLWSPRDPRVLETVSYLLRECFLEGGFFHDVSHSGINPYLTLHVAEVLLRDGDGRFFDLMKSVAGLASMTGQWPEAVHPWVRGGCMGDGQHAWASAEWIVMLRNCFVREEGEALILASGIPALWLEQDEVLFFGPTPTPFGPVTVSIQPEGEKVRVEWEGEWRGAEPKIIVRLPGQEGVYPGAREKSVVFNR